MRAPRAFITPGICLGKVEMCKKVGWWHGRNSDSLDTYRPAKFSSASSESLKMVGDSLIGNLNVLLLLMLLLLCICMCGIYGCIYTSIYRHALVMESVWKSKSNFSWVSSFLLSCVPGSKITCLPSLYGMHFDLLRRLASPRWGLQVAAKC